MSKKKIISIVAVLAVIAVGVILFITGNNAAKVSNSGIMVMTESVKRDTIITNVTAKGEVSLTNSELIYSNIGAEVDEVFVEKNDIVSTGAPLLRYREKSREDIETRLKNAQLALQNAQISLANEQIPATESDLESARIKISQSEQAITDYEMERESILSDITRQEIALQDAIRDYNNLEVLFNAGGASQSELDTAARKVDTEQNALDTYSRKLDQNQRNIDSAKDTLYLNEINYKDLQNKLGTQTSQNSIAQKRIVVEQMRLDVEQLQKELNNFQEIIYSPIDGTVTDLNVSKGEIASTEKPLMEISNIDDFVVKIDVNERNISKIALGQDVIIEGNVLGKDTVEGTVTKIGHIAESKQTTSGTEIVVPVEITVQPSPEADLLKPGFSLDASIITAVREDVLVVPILSTLTDRDGSTYVYVVKDDNTIEKRVVDAGAYADMYVEVSGIEEGEIIVSQPTLDMVDGMLITSMRIDEVNEGLEEKTELTEETEAELTEGDE